MVDCVGFTGTRKGMTPVQQRMVEGLLRAWEPKEFHHGDCIGADAQAADIARRLGIYIVSHPCTGVHDRWRAGTVSDTTLTCSSPRARNTDIVRCSTRMIAAPSSTKPQFRGSGTWMTIRISTRLQVPLIIVWPDGSVFTIPPESKGVVP